MNQAEKSLTHFRIIAETIKIEHTIFALPFALVAFFMTTQSASKLTDFFWVFVVMVSMRTFVMFSNRLIDRKIDGLNIRTANRPLVDGRLSLLSGQVYAVISVLIFLLIENGIKIRITFTKKVTETVDTHEDLIKVIKYP